ncbi:MAG: molecular chaperone SurA [Candidatus Parabeggiatoa sp. nov. 3]|nr:MAG: molecular chaperone SurA [Gammaproteobacteria bacterium]RKZ55961.1 MAG: molecular chaperone SurA [Gammaproteobacteria bacterium]RKZ77360.1 MAG: molecular chaperone SurA [Gammaproteobacteria bacterium]HEW97906.1 molecular chaperone SurA [Beggiatoa sp.]
MNKTYQSLILYCLLIISFHISAAQRETLDYIVVIVNDDVIVNTALQQQLRFEQEKLAQQNIDLPPNVNLEKRVLESMILIALQLQLAEKTGIKVEDSHLNQAVRQFAAQYKMDLKTFRQKLEQRGESFIQFREEVRHRLIIERLQHRYVIDRINVTDNEIDNLLANQVQQGTVTTEYHIWHILIATPEAPSPEEIEAKRQKAEKVLAQLKQGANFQATAVAVSDGRQALKGGDLGWVKAGQLPTLFHNLINQMAIDEIKGPIRNASGFHIIKLVNKRGGEQSIITQSKARHILIKTNELVSDFEAQNRLQELKVRIEHGDDFAELARAHSDDTGSAANGGALQDWINPGTLIPLFEKVMNAIPLKQISDPFKSPYGWHIIQVLERRQHDNTQQALRTRAKRQIHQRKEEEELQAWLRQLRDAAYIKYSTNYSSE